MNIRDLRSLIAVADWRNLRLAASTLGIDQSTLSRRIRALEENLGVSLFERHSGGMRTTPAGEEFIRSVRRGVECIERAILSANLAGAGRTGELHIGAWSISEGPLRHLVTEFSRQNTDITIRISDANAPTLCSLILERKLDLIIVAGNTYPPALDTLVIGEQRIFVAVQASASLPDNPSWRDLARLRCISPSQDEGEKLQAYVARLGGPELRILVQDCSRDTRLSLVAAGVGFVPVLEYSVKPPPAGIKYLPISGPDIVVPLRLCWLPTTDNPPLRRFISLARKLVSTRSWDSCFRPAGSDNADSRSNLLRQYKVKASNHRNPKRRERSPAK
jgi:DNA-binding transcriptional LysR family regulator